MKLEVGQKIGIYEITPANWNPQINTKLCYLGRNITNGIIDSDVQLYSKEKIYHMFYGEVRKVGSLIVKRLK